MTTTNDSTPTFMPGDTLNGHALGTDGNWREVPNFLPGDTVNGYTLGADGQWRPAKKSGPSTAVKIAAGIAAALLVTIGGSVAANMISGNSDAGASTAHITTSADTTGLTAGEEEFILDIEAIAGYDAGTADEQAFLWTGEMIVEASNTGGVFYEDFTEGFVQGFVEEGGTEAQALAFIDAAETNLG